MSWSSRWPKQPLAILWRELTLNTPLAILWRELTLSTADRRAEYFRFRQRVVDRGPELHLEKSSIVECFPGYVEQCIGHSMEHLVEITARTWGLVWFGISMFVFLTKQS
ncbi:hypothetical protein T484DRAFT_1769528 [Baffinella frigidus]|nr:hypothetical protein T484DRAFT_1769528 [Cryptophyta sp. CCMP2293]